MTTPKLMTPKHLIFVAGDSSPKPFVGYPAPPIHKNAPTFGKRSDSAFHLAFSILSHSP